MDPITIILAALVAGAGKAAGDAAPDAYKGLKALIQKKFAGKPVAEAMLEEHEKDPETYAAPLKKNLVEAGADEDEEILKAAQELLNQVKEQPGGQQIINQTVSNVKYAATSGSGNASISGITEHGTSKDS
ncbi:hypothetical protein H6F90_12370 [Trichocoleus sp. FACHB-591]|uniref:hypothetical protein n=1 Tax=Trichocoleus sp. FACHB-591 TaxID=2692872 RepID=UPI0016824B06|nr:hypothetical protein [Trichocoleus sp. FACHB-591]MBD2095943.1 hypothetical protein [Trichocoleus sp. FACHB-591]